jgi:hypothetical protein
MEDCGEDFLQVSGAGLKIEKSYDDYSGTTIF